ncbi:hypothetical protein GCM10018790_11520 [Kitasatospora xanthocidica]|uniref:hypothetical protein n=1 Tax=Kitasatospora xanthocidica TaxID=83382 RepID=UPI0016783E18|nr:hypothetical protein [Kitasatospora xanthocidica]GHF35421.1 hypothetical protein GCM10018790_11520 [Kitasatospora xanthocidica]
MFKSSIGRAAGPAVLTLILAGAAACGPTSPGTTQTGAAPAAATVADPTATAAAGTPAAPAPAAGTPRAKAASPAAGRPAAGAAAVPVTAAPAGDTQAAIGSPGKDGAAVTAATRSLQLTAYDPAGGTAVLSAAGGPAPAGPASPSAAPSAGKPSAATPPTPPPAAAPAASAPSAAASAAAVAAVQPGQLIASPPTAAAPQGALVAVTAVHPGAGNTLNLATRPATLAELLGGTEADGSVPVDPHGIKVTPLVKDLKASVGADLNGVKADASGTLEVDLKAPVPLPEGASLDASGSLQLHPAVHFAYHGAAAGSPRTASIGFDLGAHAQWKVTGDVARNTGAAPIRVPFAKLQASPVLTVAGLPVVVNLGLTCYLEVSADGQVHLEAEQDAVGTWAVRADYTGGKGWTPVTSADTKVTPVHVRLNGKAGVRAALGAEISVGLYDTVGVETTVAPYLKAQAEGSLVADSSGNPPQVQGSWSLVGGVDLNGALTAHLKVFGTPIIEGKLPLPPFHKEWPLIGGSATLPAPKSTKS